ncbi:MAG: acyl-CoA dehydrogenase family protein [Planctomycetota bacterium]|nr:acyl-CoA dehydrogenase family protein [Planctomycetota bacterium]
MHNLQLTEDQEMVVDTVRKLVSDDVAPKVQELDEHRTFVREWFDGLAELGVYALSLAEDSGGAGMGLVPYVAALEAVGEHSGSLARLWIGQAQAALAMEQAGADLDEVAAGAKLAVFVGPEHGFELKDGKLHGAAELVPAAMEADVLFVAARDGDAPALVQVDAAACQREALHSLGLNSAACGRVTCDGVAGASLDNAAAAIARAELAGFLGVAAASVGGALGAIQAAKKHAGERIAFGKPLLAQDAVQRKLVESRRAAYAAQQLTWHAARLMDLGQGAADAAIDARVAAVDALMLASDEAIQIHGGFGYTVEYHVERHYRDGATFGVLDGGSGKLRDRLASLQFA